MKALRSRYRARRSKASIIEVPGAREFAPRKMEKIKPYNMLKPKSRPFFTRSKKYFIYKRPNSGSIFPCSSTNNAQQSLYKGIPNQPIGLIPPHAIPYWAKQPEDVVYNKVEVCKPPPNGEFVPFFFYPLPFKETRSKKRVYIPQYILIPTKKNTKEMPKKYQKFIKILIRKPRTSKDRDPKDKLIEYSMPVLLKPIDPKYRKKLRNYRAKLQANKKREKFNKEFIKKPKKICEDNHPKNNPENILMNKKECKTRLRRHLRARKDKSVREISRLCHGDFGCIQTKKLELYKEHPDY